MSQKERVDLIEVDLLDMCKYILSKWVFILIGMVVFAGAGFGYAKVKSVTEYSSKMQVYVTVPKTSDKVLIRDNASEMAYDYQKLIKTDLIVNEIAKKTKIEKDDVKDAISAEVVAVGAVGGFVVVAGAFFVLYLVDLTKKAKRN